MPKISGLPPASAITGAELEAVVQSGVTKKSTKSAMLPYVQANLTLTASQISDFNTAVAATTSASCTTIPALTGDITTSGSTNVTTLASVVTPGTSPKVTYNAKGLITGGAALAAADIPTLTASKISDFAATVLTETSATCTTVPTLTGDITTTGSTNATTLKNTGSVGTYTKVTTDAQGRVSSGTTLVAADIPSLLASKISNFDTQVATDIAAAVGISVQAFNAMLQSLSTVTGVQNVTGIGNQTITNPMSQFYTIDLAAGAFAILPNMNVSNSPQPMTVFLFENIGLQANDVKLNDGTTTLISQLPLGAFAIVFFTGRSTNGLWYVFRPDKAAITSGTINNTPIGATTPSTGNFSQITLPTTGGTPSALDFYQDATLSTTFIWGGFTSGAQSIRYQRIGKCVTVYIPSLSFTSTQNSTFTSVTALPSIFRPPADTYKNGYGTTSGSVTEFRVYVTSIGLIVFQNATGGAINGTSVITNSLGITWLV